MEVLYANVTSGTNSSQSRLSSLVYEASMLTSVPLNRSTRPLDSVGDLHWSVGDLHDLHDLLDEGVVELSTSVGGDVVRTTVLCDEMLHHGSCD